MGKTIIITFIGLSIILILWCSLGFYTDREWGNLYLFVKHRPSLKLVFYSPLGEADRSYIAGYEGYLSPGKEEAETDYIEFIENHHGNERSILLFK